MKSSLIKTRCQRLVWLLVIFTGFTLIILGILRENIVFFMTPTEFLNQKEFCKPKEGQFIRLGGRVAEGSIRKEAQVLIFQLTDGEKTLSVRYEGVVPDLFREQQGVVVEGRFDSKATAFKALRLFAKHDENYIPREVVNNLKEKNLWRG